MTLSYPRKRWSDTAETWIELHLYGGRIPEITYQSRGVGRPTLKDPLLLLGEHTVELDFNKHAFRAKARALKLAHQGRTYEYVATGANKGGTLRGSAVEITTTRNKNPTGKGVSTFGSATGEVDAIDLALAILFEEVDTFDLTSFGATATALNKIRNLARSNESASMD
ncbi:hypothetical protein QNN03_14565 [Streptomyces sp. GXMU-J15]|uniref:Uncharacterized protein n=1 Tax=Streptomyces fuscus TaxID=3048495 RepID=A0ABT7IYJ8_9ACTN|nr:hypothetical protein [Streptomyces fuscus]MDL2077660.1 hypothetical protein [Streptomyces fuscus]